MSVPLIVYAFVAQLIATVVTLPPPTVPLPALTVHCCAIAPDAD